MKDVASADFNKLVCIPGTPVTVDSTKVTMYIAFTKPCFNLI